MLSRFKFRHIIIIVFSLVLTLLSSCTSRHTTAILGDVETYIQDRPDSALAVIRAIDTTTLTTRSLRAQYSLLHAIALDKNWIDTTDVGVVMPAVTYYDRHPSGIRRAKAWYYLGRIQENSGDYTTANISFLKAEKLAGDKADVNFKSLIYQSLSNTYSANYLYEEGLKYSELSFQASLKIGDTLGMNASRYRMAQDLNNLKRYYEADSLYRLILDNKGISVSLIYIHQSFRIMLSCDYCNIMIMNMQYDYLKNLFQASGQLRTHNLWGAYAYALLRVGNIKRANDIFKQLKFTDDDKSMTYKTWRSRADAYLGDFASAYEHITLASEIQLNNVNRVLRQSTLKAQRDYFIEEQVEMRSKAQKQRALLIASIVAFFVLVAGGIFSYKRKKRKMLEEQYSLIESLQSLSADYDQVKDERALIRSQYINICQAHFEQLGRINELLHNFTKEKDSNLYKEVKKAVQSIQDDENSQEEFEKILNNSLNNVMIHFRETFPNKKERYYQLVSFLFAGFNAATISTILYDYSRNNIYLLKFRLKKVLENQKVLTKNNFCCCSRNKLTNNTLRKTLISRSTHLIIH